MLKTLNKQLILHFINYLKNIIVLAVSLIYFMFFDTLLKFLWNLYLAFSLSHYFGKRNHFISFLIFCASIVLETVDWKHCKPTYHLMNNGIGVLSCVLTNKCYFQTWKDVHQPKSCAKFDDFRYIHYSQTKSVIEQISHKNSILFDR